MITIDGSAGEGGGQVLRTALALSLVTGQPFTISNIRARRSKPGLMRQHLTAVEAACVIGNAVCDGAAVGSMQLTFQPGEVSGGNYRFAVGTAGSTALVLQTVLPALMLARSPSRLRLEGGTHNPHAPPFEFLERVFLPVIRRMGAQVEARLVQPGFYPAGGGCIEVSIEPVAALRSVDLTERGAIRRCSAQAVVAALPEDIARRELAAAQRILGWLEQQLRVVCWPDQYGPGNVLLLETEFEYGTELMAGFGQFGVTAEAIGKSTALRVAGFLASKAAVGPYLADQILLPMALAGGGQFTTVNPTLHSRTVADIISRFLPVVTSFALRDDGVFSVTVV